MAYRVTGVTDDALVEFIREFIDGNRVPPLLADFVAEFGLNKSTVSHRLIRLHEAGRIKYRGNAKSRALRIIVLEEPVGAAA